MKFKTVFVFFILLFGILISNSNSAPTLIGPDGISGGDYGQITSGWSGGAETTIHSDSSDNSAHAAFADISLTIPDRIVTNEKLALSSWSRITIYFQPDFVRAISNGFSIGSVLFLIDKPTENSEDSSHLFYSYTPTIQTSYSCITLPLATGNFPKCWTKGADGAIYLGGRHAYWAKSYDGLTWSIATITVVPDTSRLYCAYYSANLNKLFMGSFHEGIDSDSARIVYSADNGSNWSLYTTINGTVSGFADWNGGMAYSIYGHNGVNYIDKSGVEKYISNLGLPSNYIIDIINYNGYLYALSNGGRALYKISYDYAVDTIDISSLFPYPIVPTQLSRYGSKIYIGYDESYANNKIYSYDGLYFALETSSGYSSFGWGRIVTCSGNGYLPVYLGANNANYSLWYKSESLIADKENTETRNYTTINIDTIKKYTHVFNYHDIFYDIKTAEDTYIHALVENYYNSAIENHTDFISPDYARRLVIICSLDTEPDSGGLRVYLGGKNAKGNEISDSYFYYNNWVEGYSYYTTSEAFSTISYISTYNNSTIYSILSPNTLMASNTSGTGYASADQLDFCIFSYKEVLGTKYFSVISSFSSINTEDTDTSLWFAWDTVFGAEGYRVWKTARDYGSWTTYHDITNGNDSTWLDDNDEWTNALFSASPVEGGDIVNADWMIGTSDWFGLTNDVLSASDIYKSRRNRANIAIPVDIDTTFDTIKLPKQDGDNWDLWYQTFYDHE